MVRLFYILLCLVWSSLAMAKQFKWKEYSFVMDVPSTWQSANDFMGVPVTMFAPMGLGVERRNVIQVMPTKAAPLKFSDAEMKAFDKNYLSRRKKWVKKRKAKLAKVETVKLEKLGDQKVLVAGSTYNWELRNFREKTFYLNCGSTLYHLKLVGDPAKAEEYKEAERVLRSFRCAQ